MPLSENEMKQIEENANQWLLDSEIILDPIFIPALLAGYHEGATVQAEKYQNDIEQYKKEIVWLKNVEEIAERELFKQLKALLASRDSELRELREVADLVVKALDYWDRTFQNDDYSLFQSLPTKDSFWRPDDGIKRTMEALAAYRKIKPEIKP